MQEAHSLSKTDAEISREKSWSDFLSGEIKEQDRPEKDIDEGS